MVRIAHIVNPVNVPQSSDLYAAQPITFESMVAARRHLGAMGEVELFATCYPEDGAVIPEGFTVPRLLNRSVMDCGEFSVTRKLPLIREILDVLYEASDAEYFIYTNVDIALMPYFYSFVCDVIEEGHDAFAINRRTVRSFRPQNSSRAGFYAQIGKKHPGFDCFVFKRAAYCNYQFETACIGANWIGRVLIANVIAHSEHFRLFEDEHLTFHLGDDRDWQKPEYKQFDEHNRGILCRLSESLATQELNTKHPITRDIYDRFVLRKPRQRKRKSLADRILRRSR